MQCFAAALVGGSSQGFAALGAVVEAVVVAVHVEHVSDPVAIGVVGGVSLSAVEQAVVVAVRVVGVRAEELLEGVRQTVLVGVDHAAVVPAFAGRRIGLPAVERAVQVRVLGAVGRAAAIGVLLQWIRLGRARVGVGDAVTCGGVGPGTAAGQPELGAVVETVVVAVGIEGVDQSVAVGVLVPIGLGAVRRTVVVAVGVVGIGPADHFVEVADAVTVGVGVADGDVRGLSRPAPRCCRRSASCPGARLSGLKR